MKVADKTGGFKYYYNSEKDKINIVFFMHGMHNDIGLYFKCRPIIVYDLFNVSRPI